jgi:hypothetical protein
MDSPSPFGNKIFVGSLSSEPTTILIDGKPDNLAILATMLSCTFITDPILDAMVEIMGKYSFCSLGKTMVIGKICSPL